MIWRQATAKTRRWAPFTKKKNIAQYLRKSKIASFHFFYNAFFQFRILHNDHVSVCSSHGAHAQQATETNTNGHTTLTAAKAIITTLKNVCATKTNKWFEKYFVSVCYFCTLALQKFMHCWVMTSSALHWDAQLVQRVAGLGWLSADDNLENWRHTAHNQLWVSYLKFLYYYFAAPPLSSSFQNGKLINRSWSVISSKTVVPFS